MITKPNWNPVKIELRKFGGVIIVGFGVIGALLYWRGRVSTAQTMWAVSSAVGLWSIIFPSLAKPFYWIWMGFGYVMGSIMSRVVMAVIFFGVLTPLAIIFRVTKRDSLGLKRKSVMESYWMDHPKMEDKKTYDHIF